MSQVKFHRVVLHVLVSLSKRAVNEASFLRFAFVSDVLVVFRCLVERGL